MNINANNPNEMNKLNNHKKKGLVLIWFYATWCGHCHNMEQEWEKLSQNHQPEVSLAKVESEDYNNYQQSPNEEMVRGYPTIRLYHNNKMVKEYDGDRSFKDIYNFIQKYLDEHPRAKVNNLMVVKGAKNKHNSKLLKLIKKNSQNLLVPKFKKSQKRKRKSPKKEKPKKKRKPSKKKTTKTK